MKCVYTGKRLAEELRQSQHLILERERCCSFRSCRREGTETRSQTSCPLVRGQPQRCPRAGGVTAEEGPARRGAAAGGTGGALRRSDRAVFSRSSTRSPKRQTRGGRSAELLCPMPRPPPLRAPSVNERWSDLVPAVQGSWRGAHLLGQARLL